MELLEVLARDVTPGVELMSWAARGSYANPSREVGVEVHALEFSRSLKLNVEVFPKCFKCVFLLGHRTSSI